MHWLYLSIAIVFEIFVALCAGKAHGFTRARWTAAMLASGAIATVALSRALLTFDVGVGYALWTSLAGVGIAVAGAIFLRQSLTWQKLVGIGVVIVGVIGLNVAST